MAKIQRRGEKLQHKWLQRRCEAAATKTGGLPPKILGRVLAALAGDTPTDGVVVRPPGQ